MLSPVVSYEFLTLVMRGNNLFDLTFPPRQGNFSSLYLIIKKSVSNLIR